MKSSDIKVNSRPPASQSFSVLALVLPPLKESPLFRVLQKARGHFVPFVSLQHLCDMLMLTDTCFSETPNEKDQELLLWKGQETPPATAEITTRGTESWRAAAVGCTTEGNLQTLDATYRRGISRQPGRKRVQYQNTKTDFTKRILLTGLTVILAAVRHLLRSPWSVVVEVGRQEEGSFINRSYNQSICCCLSCPRSDRSSLHDQHGRR